MSNEINYDELIEVSVSMLKGAKSEIFEAIDIIKNGQYPKDIGKVANLLKNDVVIDVVKIVEAMNTILPKAMTGEEKKTLVVKILNKLIDIPVVWEALEEDLIEFAVDSLVESFNKIFGKNWLNKVNA